MRRGSRQVKVGDAVTATYYDRISVRLKTRGRARGRSHGGADHHADGTGALPGATRTKQRVATVTITGWSPVDKVVTFIGPNGTAYSRRLLDTTDPAIVEGLKVGDRVDVTRTEAVTVSVQSAPTTRSTRLRRAQGPPHGLGPLRVGQPVQWQDDQGSHWSDGAWGSANQPGARRPTTMCTAGLGCFKIGVGYRTTPRAEAVFNFVWSSSDAEEGGVQIGTVGASTAAIPLTVQFTSFSYWGLEVGQRWFFARTRFTPFVGYLVGANRHQDIRGTFVNVPPDLTPALAAQDGKFFEKSLGAQRGSDRWRAHRRGSVRG